MRVRGQPGKREGGVGPAIRIEDTSRNPLNIFLKIELLMHITFIECHAHLHITGDGVCDKLYCCDQKTPGQKEPCCELIISEMRSSKNSFLSFLTL